jgi:hypothetical protein
MNVFFKEAGCEKVDWIQLAQVSPVSGYCENDNKLASSIKGREFLGQLSAY